MLPEILRTSLGSPSRPFLSLVQEIGGRKDLQEVVWLQGVICREFLHLEIGLKPRTLPERISLEKNTNNID